jgi:hypothetical protein
MIVRTVWVWVSIIVMYVAACIFSKILSNLVLSLKNRFDKGKHTK